MRRSVSGFIVVLLLACAADLQAQQLYLDSLYSDIQKETHTYYTKPDQKLKLDLYEPVEHKEGKRPMLLYVHGGSFSGGKRDHPNHEAFCKAMASKGYVTATMSYTLQMKGKSFGCDLPAPKKIETFLKTSRDVNRAVSFLLDNHSEFGIDTTRIVLLGSSAGAEAVLHTAYWKAARTDDQGRILSSSFEYGGVVSMAGALTNIGHITEESALPTQLFHGTCDGLVPYGEAPHHYCSMEDPGYLTLYGGHAVMERLRELGKGYYMVTGCNGRHEWNSLPLTDYRDEITDFVYHDVVKGEKRQIHKIVPTQKASCEGIGEWEHCK